MRAVIYARYSSDKQSETSIEDQVRICEGFIAGRSWQKDNVYTDKALSGSNRFRPAYQQMLIDARNNTFDVVVAEALDRLSRDQEDIAGLYKALRFAGISLFTIAEGEITELHVGLKGTMNALFLKDLAAKTHRGLRGRIEDKRSAGGICFGYRIRRELDGNGEPLRGAREIAPEEAMVVARIFEDFSKGSSPMAIAKRLNAEGIPGPNGRPWQDTTIRGHAKRGTGILRNELYVGRLIWNRQRFIRDPQTGKRVSRMNPPDQWIIKDIPELRIINDELWSKTKSRLADIAASPLATAIRENGFWSRKRAKHILTGLVYCGACGHPMAAVGKDYLRCSRAHRNGLCTSKASIRRNTLEELVIKALQRNLMKPDLVKEFVAAANEEFNRGSAKARAERDVMEAKFIKVDKQINSLVEAIADGLRGSSIQAKLEMLEADRADLEAKLAEPSPSPIRLMPNLADLYRQKVATLHESLVQDDTRTEALEIIRSLIDKVVVHEEQGGPPSVELIGDIAHMIEVAMEGPETQKTTRKGVVLSDREQSSVVVVAGAGFEPATFRL